MLYLHKDFRLKIIHQYLKVSNVLLDINEMNLKIYDFVMEMIFSSNKGEANTT
jgi:serine/threonine protein kinase